MSPNGKYFEFLDTKHWSESQMLNFWIQNVDQAPKCQIFEYKTHPEIPILTLLNTNSTPEC
jgi:hypothetical protein